MSQKRSWLIKLNYTLVVFLKNQTGKSENEPFLVDAKLNDVSNNFDSL